MSVNPYRNKIICIQDGIQEGCQECKTLKYYLQKKKQKKTTTTKQQQQQQKKKKTLTCTH